ncbi:MAG: hypothetical protein HYV09_25780 [Deltaproteobacteria bacterium]|nr:hypothetical protein [Deltaproteobacteria bacterium]
MKFEHQELPDLELLKIEASEPGLAAQMDRGAASKAAVAEPPDLARHRVAGRGPLLR